MRSSPTPTRSSCSGRTCSATSGYLPEADADLAAIEAIVREAGGEPVENTIPKVMRANPFPNVNSMVGPSGERWVPTHGIVRHGRALPTLEAIVALYEEHRTEMERHEIGAGHLFLGVGTTGFLVEPVFFWPDALDALHADSVEPGHFARLTRFPPNAEARALVERLRAGLIEVFTRMEAVHMQIGRAYPLSCRADPAGWELLRAVKAQVDPRGLMNPGVLGL